MTKTLQKKFSSFEAEEQWLNELASFGWLLVSYSNDDFGETTYTFEQHEHAKNGHYKLDFVTFQNRADFDDYKELMEESGWQLLAENEYYGKLILFSTKPKPLFSDRASELMRETRKRRAAIRLAVFLFTLAALAALAQTYIEHGLVFAIAIAWAVGGTYYSFIALRLTLRLRKELPA